MKSKFPFQSFLELPLIALSLFLFASGEKSIAESSIGSESKIEVLVASQVVNAGEQLQPLMFRTESRPRNEIPKNPVTSFEQIHWTYARTQLKEGVVLTRDHISLIRPSSVISAQVPEGFRAVSTAITVSSDAETWLVPGAHVDVVWRTEVDGKPSAKVIAQFAKILSVGYSKKWGVSVGAANSVTLLVTDEDSLKIQLAQTAGSISVTLRGDIDFQLSSTGEFTVEDLHLSDKIPDNHLATEVEKKSN